MAKFSLECTCRIMTTLSKKTSEKVDVDETLFSEISLPNSCYSRLLLTAKGSEKKSNMIAKLTAMTIVIGEF